MSDQLEIERLIAQENDPKTRLQLMIINKVSLNLADNTATIAAVAVKVDTHINNFERHLEHFEQHTAQEDIRLGQGRVIWKIVSWGLGAAQAIIIWLAVQMYSELQGLHGYDKALDARLHTIEIKTNERN